MTYSVSGFKKMTVNDARPLERYGEAWGGRGQFDLTGPNLTEIGNQTLTLSAVRLQRGRPGDATRTKHTRRSRQDQNPDKFQYLTMFCFATGLYVVKSTALVQLSSAFRDNATVVGIWSVFVWLTGC